MPEALEIVTDPERIERIREMLVAPANHNCVQRFDFMTSVLIRWDEPPARGEWMHCYVYDGKVYLFMLDILLKCDSVFYAVKVLSAQRKGGR